MQALSTAILAIARAGTTVGAAECLDVLEQEFSRVRLILEPVQ
jgi:hypothetical protein